MENKEFINDGVILGSKPTDYVGGTIPYEVRNPSGDWTPYLPVGEIQKGKVDWMDCTVRSGTNVVEIQEKFLMGKESNYNDREAAKGCEVTQQGAYLWQFAEYARKTGLAQQSTYLDSGGDWEEQYKFIPADIRVKLDAEKADWLTKWSILHEDIPYDKKSLQYHLKHVPLQIVIPGHATVDILSLADIDRIFDSYEPFVKDVPSVYYPGQIVFAKKIVLYKKENALDPDTLLIDLKYGDTGSQVLRLKRVLKRLGWFLSDGIEAQDNWDIYNDKIADLAMRFKMANIYGNSYWGRLLERYLYKGREINARDREYINNLIK